MPNMREAFGSMKKSLGKIPKPKPKRNIAKEINYTKSEKIRKENEQIKKAQKTGKNPKQEDLVKKARKADKRRRNK